MQYKRMGLGVGFQRKYEEHWEEGGSDVRGVRELSGFRGKYGIWADSGIETRWQLLGMKVEAGEFCAKF